MPILVNEYKFYNCIYFMKLTIELVPSTIWRSNIRSLVSREVWDKIRKEQYEKAGHKCEICGVSDRLHCHELWKYDDEYQYHIQRLDGFIILCENCHMIKHAGFSMHTLQGSKIYDRNTLTEHFCKVNNCKREDFIKHENEAFKEWEERSKFRWKQDFE